MPHYKYALTRDGNEPGKIGLSGNSSHEEKILIDFLLSSLVLNGGNLPVFVAIKDFE